MGHFGLFLFAENHGGRIIAYSLDGGFFLTLFFEYDNPVCMKNLILAIAIFWGCCASAADQSSINDYVKKAPMIDGHSQLSSVVKYIEREYKKDEDIARAVLAWIVYNIDYDDYYYRQVDKDLRSRRDLSTKIPEQGDIIETRLGVCKDIAALYSEMLTMADIKSRVISGCNAPKNDKVTCARQPHAWNAVWIEKQWELVDPTFAMGQARALQDVSTKRSYEKMVKKREKRNSKAYEARKDRHVDTRWFMVDPQKMAEDHQPSDEKWYLTKRSDRKRKD